MSERSDYQPLSQSEPSLHGASLGAKVGVPLKRPVCQGRSNVTKRTWVEAGVILLIGILAALATWYMMIQFKPQPTPVAGYGTSFSNLLISKTLESYSATQARGKAYPIYYTNENVPDFDRIVNGSTMFVAYDNPDQPSSDYRDLTVFPVIAAAVLPVAHFGFETPDPPVLEKFTLTRDHLVGIYNGTIKRFCNISSYNPVWNQWICARENVNITVLHREEASGTNFIFTSGMASFSSSWRAAYPPGLKTTWPPDIGKDLITSNSQMIRSISLHPWSIGYLPVPDFKDYMFGKDLPTVHPIDIWNPTDDGHSMRVVSAMEPESLQSAVDYGSSHHASNAWNQSLVNLPCEKCWPFSGYSYIAMRTDYSKALGYNSVTTVSETVDFMDYFLKSGIPNGVSKFSYVSPPQALITQAQTLLQNIKFHGKLVSKLHPLQYDALAAGLIMATALIASIVRLAIPLCMKPKSANGRPMSRVTRDELFEETSHHSLMRQILENDEAITSPRPPRMDDTLRKAMIDTGELVMQRQIGKGAAGDVFIGTYIGAIVAIKRMMLPTNSERMSVVETFVREASTMALLRHPNIVQFLGASVSPPYVYLITEYCSQDSLYDVLHGDRKRPLDRSQKRAILIDAALGIMYLHGKGIVHRDIKTHNLLVDRTGTVKVADFGTSTALGFNLRATGSENNMKTMVGTPEYVAPEVINPKGKGYSYKADIYSFGIVAWEVWSGLEPYHDLAMIDILFSVTTKGIRPPIDVIDDPDLLELIQLCWATDPDQRPTFDDILSVLRDLEEDSE